MPFSITATPSAMRMMFCAFLASSMLCVTSTTLLPMAQISRSSFMTSAPLTESRLPVGSSAKTISGSCTSARAMETRCFCPPDSSLAFLFVLSESPSFSKISHAFFSRAFLPTPLMVSGMATLSKTVNVGSR